MSHAKLFVQAEKHGLGSYILKMAHSSGENFTSPQLRDKIWEWPGNEVRSTYCSSQNLLLYSCTLKIFFITRYHIVRTRF